MMKFLLFLLIPLISFGQLKHTEEGILYYEEVVSVEKDASTIHDAIEEFLATYAGDSNYAIKLNKEDQILSKGNIPIVGPNHLNIVLNTEFKEGRYRILIDEILLNNKAPFTDNKDVNTQVALDQMEKMYIKQGKLSEFQELKESGEAEKQVAGFVEMNKFFYPKGEEKLLAFVDSLKEYVLNYNKNSDW